MTSREEAHDAVRTLLGYIEGIDAVDREGLVDTPKRVIDSWSEIFAGYSMNATELLDSTFNAEGYDGIVLLRNIEFTSMCEHPSNLSEDEPTLATYRSKELSASANLHDCLSSTLAVCRIKSASQKGLQTIWKRNLNRSAQRSSLKHLTVACSAGVLLNSTPL